MIQHFLFFPPGIFCISHFLSKPYATQFYSLGVAPDFLGGLFWHTLPKLAPTRKAAVTALFKEMRQWYQDNGVENRLLTLTELMIRKKANSSPKLRSTAAEARALVPFGVWFLICALTISIFVFFLKGSLWSLLFFLQGGFCLAHCYVFHQQRFAQEYLTGGSVADQTIIACAEELLKTYELLSSEAFRPEAMNDHCTRFCLLYGSLEQRDACLWIVKPKFHQFQEIAQSGSNPSMTWCYREEDFGGFLAQTSRRRGGLNSPKAVARAVFAQK